MKTSSKLGAAAILILLALLPMNIACAQAQKQQVLQQSIKTIYPTKDWAISDFVVTDPAFGAKAEPGFDNRGLFRRLLTLLIKAAAG